MNKQLVTTDAVLGTVASAIGASAATVVFASHRVVDGIKWAFAPDYPTYDETIACRVTQIASRRRH